MPHGKICRFSVLELLSESGEDRSYLYKVTLSKANSGERHTAAVPLSHLFPHLFSTDS